MDLRLVDDYRRRVRGSLLGGAVGDALGGPVEFSSLETIRGAHGPAGLREFVGSGYGRPGLITDDTQMTLFTMEGLIRAGVRTDRFTAFPLARVDHAYDRWYRTQTDPAPPAEPDGWLAGRAWLYSRRAPGTTCLTALGGRPARSWGHQVANDSKGCGTVMRTAPFGWLPEEFDHQRFEFAADAAGFTHGHVTAKLASGAMAVLIAQLMRGHTLDEALDTATAQLRHHDGHEETSRALANARAAARSGPPSAETLTTLGGAWIAEEALAIAVYAALCHPGPREMLDALALSVTHSGDSDSTGAICGNILGALHGDSALPPELAFEVEGRGDMLELADDFVWEFTDSSRLHRDGDPHTRWTVRYPGI